MNGVFYFWRLTDEFHILFWNTNWWMLYYMLWRLTDKWCILFCKTNWWISYSIFGYGRLTDEWWSVFLEDLLMNGALLSEVSLIHDVLFFGRSNLWMVYFISKVYSMKGVLYFSTSNRLMVFYFLIPNWITIYLFFTGLSDT